MLVLIKDNEQRNNARLTHLEAIHLIEDRMGLKLKTTFVSKLRREETKYLQVRTLYDDGLKRVVKDRLEELSDKLEEFYEEMNAKGASITDEVLIMEAKEIASKQQLTLPKGFNFSCKWLLHWKRRRNIMQQELHGEAGDACQIGIDLCRRHLPGILGEFALENIYNLDETGLFYRRLPTRTLMRGMKKGKKLSKLRCTINFIVNASGNEMHLQVIGSAMRPRAFGRSMKPYETYHIDYYANKTSWMRSDIFVDVLEKFSLRVARRTKKNVLLIMDNFSAHRIDEKRIKKLTFCGGLCGYQFKNLICLFLPPNVTSVIQPLDQGIIAAFKAHYRRHHIQFLIDQLKNGAAEKDVKVNMLQVLQWC